MTNIETQYFASGGLFKKKEDAERARACVNALRDYPIEVIEREPVQQTHDHVLYIESAEDRRFVAAAVKACKEIPTEALEAGVVGELMEGLSILAYEAERRAGVPRKYVANARELLTQAGYYEQCRKTLAKAKGDAHAAE